MKRFIKIHKGNQSAIKAILGKKKYCLSQLSPTFVAPGTSFVEDNLTIDWGWGGNNGFGMIQEHYMYCALYSIITISAPP